MKGTLDEDNCNENQDNFNSDEVHEHDVHEAEENPSPGTNKLVALAVIVSYK